MSQPARIGVLGGTFDPIHRAHLELARAAMQQARLDQVLFVVSASPPHKRGDVRLTAEERFALVAAALEEEPHMVPCRIEMDREGPSYTADTLGQLQLAYPGAQLFLILGMDAVQDLPRWNDPDLIVERAHILAAPRKEGDAAIPEMLRNCTTVLDFKPLPVSSTQVRARLEAGEDSEELPAPVRGLIMEKGWYARSRSPIPT